MKIRNLLVVLLGVFLTVLFFVPAPVSAAWTINFGDDGFIPNSSTDVTFDKVVFVIPDTVGNTGVTWSGSGVTNFSISGWDATVNGRTVVATGTAVPGTLFWTTNFTNSTNSAPANFELDYLVYAQNTGTPAFGIKLNLSNGQLNLTQGTGWQAMSSTELNEFKVNQPVVPVPPAALLFGTGLVGVVALRKRITDR